MNGGGSSELDLEKFEGLGFVLDFLADFMEREQGRGYEMGSEFPEGMVFKGYHEFSGEFYFELVAVIMENLLHKVNLVNSSGFMGFGKGKISERGSLWLLRVGRGSK